LVTTRKEKTVNARLTSLRSVSPPVVIICVASAAEIGLVGSHEDQAREAMVLSEEMLFRY
jgi:hypothetical protein